MFGRVKVYNLGFVIFTVGSGLCVLGQTGEQLIIFRVIQGLGGAMLIANAAALITDATPLSALGFALGVNQIGFVLGAVLGLTIGGLLIETVGWRSIFAINIPVGIFGTLWAHLRLHEISKREKHSSFDYLGFCLFTTSLTSLLVVISLVTMGSIDELEAAILYLISLVTFALFLYYEPRKAEPLLDMRLFKIRLFSAGNLSQLLYSLGFGSLTLIVILYFQIIRGYDAFTAGLLLLPLDAAFVCIGPVSGKLSDRYGTRGLTTLGMGVGTVGYVILAFLLTATTPLEQIEIVLVVLGIGFGLFSSPNISSVMGSVPAERRGVASGIRSTVFNSGSVVSIGLVAYIITTVMPYQVVSGIVSGGYTTLTLSESLEFVTGIGRAFIVTTIITLIGMFVSSLRGREAKTS
jgi:EmrB/QacA subfamily drug resistance transporter